MLSDMSRDRLDRVTDALAAGRSMDVIAADEGVTTASLERWLYRVGRVDLIPPHTDVRKTGKCADCGEAVRSASTVCRACYRKQVADAATLKCANCGKRTSHKTKTGLCQTCYLDSRAAARTCKDCGATTPRADAARCRPCAEAFKTRRRKPPTVCIDCGAVIRHPGRCWPCYCEHVKAAPRACPDCGGPVSARATRCWRCSVKARPNSATLDVRAWLNEAAS